MKEFVAVNSLVIATRKSDNLLMHEHKSFPPFFLVLFQSRFDPQCILCFMSCLLSFSTSRPLRATLTAFCFHWRSPSWPWRFSANLWSTAWRSRTSRPTSWPFSTQSLSRPGSFWTSVSIFLTQNENGIFRVFVVWPPFDRKSLVSLCKSLVSLCKSLISLSFTKFVCIGFILCYKLILLWISGEK